MASGSLMITHQAEYHVKLDARLKAHILAVAGHPKIQDRTASNIGPSFARRGYRISEVVLPRKVRGAPNIWYRTARSST